MKTAHAFFEKAGVRPYKGSIGLANAYLAQALETAGYRTQVHGPAAVSTVERLLPLHLAKARAELVAASPADLALYDDRGLGLCAPGRQWARRTAVYYHGLFWNAGSWLGSDAIDLHLGNSEYIARVLAALLAFPDWERRRCLDPRAFGKVAAVPLALPCVEEPDGSPDMLGGEIPPGVRALLDGGDVVGHALQGYKLDVLAAGSILLTLNELAREAGGRPVRLLTLERSLPGNQVDSLRRLLEPHGWTPEDFFVPVPALNQRALFQLMRQCAFGLAYNTIPESFGFYVLESVHNGCPVFTNGCGNMRHLLPEEHGFEVFETAAMAEEDPDAYAAVAHRIHAALSDRAALRAKCAKGRAYIDAHYHRGAMEAALGAALALPEAPLLDFESLRVEIGPLVRQHDRAAGIVVSDLRSVALSPGQARALDELPGRACAELKALDPDARSLFGLGVLSLRAAAG